MSESKSLPTSLIRLISKKQGCRCMCIKRPVWNIPPIADLYSVGDSSKAIVLQSLRLEGTIMNSTASISYTQVFRNSLDKPIECIYKFPIDPSFAVTGLSIMIGDKEIEAEIMPKEEAKQEYDDAVAAGHSAVKLSYDEKLPDVIELNLGQLQAGCNAEIWVRIVWELEVIKHGFFSFVFPMEFFPRYGDKTGIPGQEGKYLPADFSLDFKIKSNSVVTNLDVSHQEMTYEQNEDGTEVSITIEMCETVVAKDIVISYSSEQIRQPQLTLTKCAKFPGEVAAHISFIPRSSEEHEVEDEEIKHTDANVTEVDDHDDPEVANGEFIFILDRSGSMSGSRIKLAVEALELFIKSIPSNSKFNVVSFGSSYRFMFDESKEYNNENMQDALDQIKHFKSDFGGTELYMPIEKTVSMNQDFQCPRNVFVLTDGGISDTQRVLDKIREFNFATRVHSFGIGSGASAYLVKEIAKEGKGTSTLIADNDPHLKGKVIKALKLASKPAFTNLRIDWQDNAKSVKLCTPAEPYVPNVYEEEPFHVYAILKEEDLAASSVAVTLFNTHEQTEDTVVLQIPAEIAESADGQDFQLAAKHFIEYASRKNSEVSEQEVERVSVKYSVLCSKTAFFGKVKNKTKPTEEMETIQIPIKKLQKERFNDFDGMIGSRLQCMSKRSVGMTRLIDKSENLCLSSQQFSTKTKKKGGIFSAIGSAIGSIFGGSDEIERDMCPKRVSARCPSKQAVLSRAYQGQDDLDSYEECEKMSTPEYKSKNEQEYSKQSLSSSKASSSASSGYTEVTDFQDSVGFFAGLPAKFAHLLDAAVPESVLESLYDKADAQRVWVTILALAVLKKHFADLEDEWTMMAKKAEAYLKSMHVKKYKQEVKNSIAIV